MRPITGPMCYVPGHSNALELARRQDTASQRARELRALFGRLEGLRDLCLQAGHSAADFRTAALELLDGDFGR